MLSRGLVLEPCSQPVTLASQVTSLMIEPDYDLKKIKGDSRRASAVLAPEREVFSANADEDEAPSAQETAARQMEAKRKIADAVANSLAPGEEAPPIIAPGLVICALNIIIRSTGNRKKLRYF